MEERKKFTLKEVCNFLDENEMDFYLQTKTAGRKTFGIVKLLENNEIFAKQSLGPSVKYFLCNQFNILFSDKVKRIRKWK
jgi:hypothetical protein